LVVLTAFSVVFGTLMIRGLPLKPLLRAPQPPDNDPVGREVDAVRERELHAGLRRFATDGHQLHEAKRHEFKRT
jgi:CPA1 family monovalent cation:H+ antiporter